MFVDSPVPLTSLVLLLCWFSLWFLIYSNLRMIHPDGSELDAALSIMCKQHVICLQQRTTTVVHCDKISLRQHEVIITNMSQQQLEHVANNDMYKLVSR